MSKNIGQDGKYAQKSKKTNVKKAGVKSTFVLNDQELVMTSFGRGNSAVIEKRVNASTGDIQRIADPEQYDAKSDPGSKSITVQKKRNAQIITGSQTMPVQSESKGTPLQPGRTAGKDMIGIKDAVEKRFFKGAPFSDNIHIQIAYCILDIEKIMASHINNIVYEIRNLFREDDASGLRLSDAPDLALNNFMERMNLWRGFDSFAAIGADRRNDYQQKQLFEALMKSPRRMYLGAALYSDSVRIRFDKDHPGIADINDKEQRAELSRCYLELCLIGMCRNYLFHGEEIIDPSDKEAETDGSEVKALLYTLDDAYDGYLYPDQAKNRDKIQARKDARRMLDDLYAERVKSINNSFLNNAAGDLTVFFSILGAKTQAEKNSIVKQYYDFVVRKPQLNEGFSIKQIRNLFFTNADRQNTLLTIEGKLITVDDSMRSKFYKDVDFILYRYYSEHPQEGSAIIDALRTCGSGKNKEHDEAEKLKVYQAEALRLWPAFKEAYLPSVLDNVNGDKYGALVKGINKKEFRQVYELSSGSLLSSSAEYFSELVYMLCLFLEGKEINDMLTQLTSKFENIAEFIRMLKAEGLPCEFSESFKMFEIAWDAQGLEKLSGAAKIAGELRTVTYISKMQSKDPDANIAACEDALTLLGFDASAENAEMRHKYAEYIMTPSLSASNRYKGYNTIVNAYNKKRGFRLSESEKKELNGFIQAVADLDQSLPMDVRQSEIEDIADEQLPRCYYNQDIVDIARFIIEKDGTLKAERAKALQAADIAKLPDAGFRNFLANNVIDSRRFNYLVRYSNPAKLAAIAKNKAVVRFVLKTMEDKEQLLEKYHQACFGRKDSVDKMTENLTGLIAGLSYEDFLDVDQKQRARNGNEKDRKQRVLGLYITVLYLLVKNMVNINSRYSLAFHCCERDYLLLKGSRFGKKDDWIALTRDYCAGSRIKPSNRGYLENNIKALENTQAIRDFRNIVCHLEHIQNLEQNIEKIRVVDSYYALYHYALQKCLEAKPGNAQDGSALAEYFRKLDSYGTYVKDFVKALNVPFGYNLPRYKNLSIEGLFDRNRPGDRGSIKLSGE